MAEPSRPGVLRLAALLADPRNGDLRHVAGPNDVPWDHATVEATESDLPPDGTRSIAIITSAVPAEPWQRDALLRRVRDRGFGALIVAGAPAFDAGTMRLAERLRIALLTVDRPIDLARTCWMLVQGRDALTLTYVRKVASAFQYAAHDLGDLLAHIAANLGFGVALVDPAGAVREAGGRVSDQLLAAIDFAVWTDIARTDQGTAASVRVASPTRPGLRLVVFGEGLGEPQLQSLAVAAEIAMPAVAARILIDEVAAVNDSTISSGLLREFLDLNGSPDVGIERRMLERGWRTAGYHIGFRVDGLSAIDPFPLLQLVTSELGSVDAESHATTAGSGVTGWLTFAFPPDADRFAAHIAGLRRVHENVRKGFPVAMGVGSVRSGAAGLTSSIADAADAARLAARRSTSGWFLSIDGLRADQLLLSSAETDTFRPAAAALLAPLLSRGPELVDTLTSYLDHGSQIAAAADALGLHRNTVSQRVQRATELLGLDLTEPDTRLAVHLACRALRR